MSDPVNTPVYMTAKLNLANGTIIYPQISLDNIVRAIDDPTLVTVAETVGGKVPVTELPVVNAVASTGSTANIPTEYAVRALANTKQDTLTGGAGVTIADGTISFNGTTLDVTTIDSTKTNGVFLSLDGSMLSAKADMAANDSAGVIAGAADGVTLDQGVAKANPGDGLLIEDNKVAIDDASVETTLQDARIDGASTVTPVNDQVVTPGNLRGALSVGQAVDVSCAPAANGRYGSVVINGTTTSDIIAALSTDGAYLQEFTLLKDDTEGSQHWLGWLKGAANKFPKGAPGLKYLWIADVCNEGDAASDIGIWVVNTRSAALPATARAAGQTVYSRLWNTEVCPADGLLSGNISWWPRVAGSTCRLSIKNWRQYEVTALTDEAIAYLANYGADPDDPVAPDAFFRSTSVKNLRDKYLVKQDMVCPWIYTIGMPDNSNLTVGAGLSYKIKYTDNNPHNVTVDTIPDDAYGWDAHIQMFVKGASNVVFEPPLVLMDSLTSNAGHNLSVKFRNGQAFVYVDDKSAGYTVVTATGTADGSLPYGLTYTVPAGQTETGYRYIIFAGSLNGQTCEAGTVTPTRETTILGNGRDSTIISGNLTNTSGSYVSTLVFQDLAIAGGTLTAPYVGGWMEFDNVKLGDTTLKGSGSYIFNDVLIPAGATVTVDHAGQRAQASLARFVFNKLTLDGFLDFSLTDVANKLTPYTAVIDGNGTGTFKGQLRTWDATAVGPLTVSGFTWIPGGSDGMCFNGPCGLVATNVHFYNRDDIYPSMVFSLGPREAYLTNCTVEGFRRGTSSGAAGAVGTLICVGCTFKNNRSDYSELLTNAGNVAGKYTWSFTNCSFLSDEGYKCYVVTMAGMELTLNIAGTLTVTGDAHLAGQTSDAGYCQCTIQSNTVIDLSAWVPANPDNLGFILPFHNDIVFGDNITLKTKDNRTVTWDAIRVGYFWGDGRFTQDSNYPKNFWIPRTTSVPTWRANGLTIAKQLDASNAADMRLTNTKMAGTAAIVDKPGRIQLPTGEENSNSFVGNTNDNSTKILQAAVIVAGNNAASPSGNAFVEIEDGTTSSYSGIGTFIKRDGSNDFRPATSTYNVTGLGSNEAAGTLNGALTSATNAAATSGTTQFVKLALAANKGSASAASAKTYSGVMILDSTYKPLFGGAFTVSQGGMMQVFGNERITDITRQSVVLSSACIPAGNKLQVSSGATVEVIDGSTIEGGGVVDLSNTRIEAAAKSLAISGTTVCNGHTPSDGSFGGGAICFPGYNQPGAYKHLVLKDCAFVNNVADGTKQGGALYCSSHFDVNASNCLFQNNSGAMGGAIHLTGGNPCTFSNCTFVDNVISGTSDCRQLNTWTVNVALVSCTFSGTDAVSESTSGGFSITGGATCSITGCYFDEKNGITLANTGTNQLTISGYNIMKSTIKGNGANASIQMQPGAVLDFGMNTHASPLASAGGGIVFPQTSNVYIVPSVGRTSGYYVGGITLNTLRDDNVVDFGGTNRSTDTAGQLIYMNGATVTNGLPDATDGAAGFVGIFSGGIGKFESCTFSGGKAKWAGALQCSNGQSVLSATSCNFSSNTAATGNGQAVHVTGGATVVLTKCNFNNNGNGSSPEVTHYQGNLTLTGCTFSGNGTGLKVTAQGAATLILEGNVFNAGHNITCSYPDTVNEDFQIKGSNTIQTCSGGQGTITISSGASITLADKIATTGGSVVVTGGTCKVNGHIIQPNTYTQINADGTTVPPQA